MGQTSLHWLFFLTSLLCCTTNQDQHEVNAKLGEDATLPCRGHGNATIEVIKWNRTDLKSGDIYVFFFRDGSSNENNTHESFRGRVELKDPEMKDGDASVILKNVTFNDTGTYECRVREENETGKAKLISIINMTVTEPGHTAGHKEGGDKEGGDKERNVGLMVGLPVVAVLLAVVAVVGTMLFKKRRGETPHTGGETPHTGGETPHTGGETPHTGGETPHTGGETPHTGGETDALNPPTSG